MVRFLFFAYLVSIVGFAEKPQPRWEPPRTFWQDGVEYNNTPYGRQLALVRRYEAEALYYQRISDDLAAKAYAEKVLRGLEKRQAPNQHLVPQKLEALKRNPTVENVLSLYEAEMMNKELERLRTGYNLTSREFKRILSSWDVYVKEAVGKRAADVSSFNNLVTDEFTKSIAAATATLRFSIELQDEKIQLEGVVNNLALLDSSFYLFTTTVGDKRAAFLKLAQGEAKIFFDLLRSHIAREARKR